jgi:uncharacterized protein (DUF1697 family)
VPAHLALLRAVNVGGRTVRMADLRRWCEELGLTDVRTFIASGNVLFDAARTAGLEGRIEHKLASELGFAVEAFVRSADEWRRIATWAPIAGPAVARCVGCVRDPLDGEQQARLQALASEADRFAVRGREVYWHCASKQSDSAFSAALFERRVGVPITFRSHTTVAKLAGLL